MPRHSFLLLGLHQKSPCATMSRSALEGARRHIVRNLPATVGGGGVTCSKLGQRTKGQVSQAWDKICRKAPKTNQESRKDNSRMMSVGSLLERGAKYSESRYRIQSGWLFVKLQRKQLPKLEKQGCEWPNTKGIGLAPSSRSTAWEIEEELQLGLSGFDGNPRQRRRQKKKWTRPWRRRDHLTTVSRMKSTDRHNLPPPAPDINAWTWWLAKCSS